MKSSPGDFRAALLERGASTAYASKMQRVVERYAENPLAALQEAAPRMTQSTLDDLVTRLRVYGKWVDDSGGDGGEWRMLPRMRAGRAAQPRVSMSLEEVRKLLRSDRIPAHRRAFYRAQAAYGLRPVEASRITEGFLVRTTGGYDLRLPADMQKSGRPDIIGVSVKDARDFLKNLPLLRTSLNNYDRVFPVDTFRAGIGDQVNGVRRRMYDLRSFFISELLRKKVDLKAVQLLARHADIKTTLRHYARHQASFVQEAREAALNNL